MQRSILLLALVCMPARAVRADDGGVGRDAPLLVRLARSAADRHRDHVAERARTLERLVRSLPGVLTATAALTIDDVTGASLDRPLAPTQDALVLRVRGQGPSDAELRALAGSVVGDLAADGLTVSRHPVAPPPAPAMVRVGPLEVAAASATLLRATLAASLAGNVLLASLLLWRARPTRPRRPFVDPRGRGRPRA